MKIYLYDVGHMTEIAAMSIYGKNSVTSGTQAHYSMLPWLTMTCYTPWSNFLT